MQANSGAEGEGFKKIDQLLLILNEHIFSCYQHNNLLVRKSTSVSPLRFGVLQEPH
jgi:hypothetical protein